MRNDDFPQRVSRLVVTECRRELIETEDAVNDWLHPSDGNRSVHADELGAISRRDNAHSRDGSVEHIYVERRRSAAEESNELDLAFPRRRLNRTFQCGAGGVDDLVDAPTSGELAYGQMPIGRGAVIDDAVGSKRLKTLRLLIARGERDDPRSEQLRKLQREQRDASRAERENCIAGLKAP